MKTERKYRREEMKLYEYTRMSNPNLESRCRDEERKFPKEIIHENSDIKTLNFPIIFSTTDEH